MPHSGLAKSRSRQVRGRIHSLVKDSHNLDDIALRDSKIDKMHGCGHAALFSARAQMEAAQPRDEGCTIAGGGTRWIPRDGHEGRSQQPRVALLAIGPPAFQAH